MSSSKASFEVSCETRKEDDLVLWEPIEADFSGSSSRVFLLFLFYITK
jgi:hypothetical protein